jgi:hypothetical protein
MSDTFVNRDFAIPAVETPSDAASASVVPVEPIVNVAARSCGGRPRISPDAPQTGAERAKRQRQRKKQAKAEAEIPVPTSDNIDDWDEYLNKVGLSISRGEFMEDAPRSTGRLVSGGYDYEKIGYVTVANENAPHGRKVKPKGTGPDTPLRNETRKKK